MNRAVALVFLLASALPVSAAKPRRTRRAASPKAAAPVKPAAPAIPPAPPLYTRSTEPVTFVWPPEGLALAAEGEFVLGSVNPATAPFSINGQVVTVHKDGGFLHWTAITPGTFTFRGEVTLSSGVFVAERRIAVATPGAPLPEGKPAIDPASLSPKTDLDLRTGDWLVARMKATRGAAARVRLGKGPWRAMRETNAAHGIYETAWPIAPGEASDPAPLEYEASRGWSSARAKGTARVSANSRPAQIATTKGNGAGFVSLKTGPSNGFLAFPLPGTRLAVTGREGTSLRVRLSETLSGWVEAKDVELTTGTAPARPVTGTIGVTRTEDGAMVRVGLSEKVVFDLEPSADLDALTVRLHGAIGHTNWVVNDAPDFVREIRWRQETTDCVAVTIFLQKGRRLWGWWPSFDGSSLKLELRRAPTPGARGPLAGLKIVLDPGHMPSATGATGPLGTKEMDANYAIARAVEERLRREGALPVLTRDTTSHEVALVDRPRLALERDGDLFVSLHNNALPEGENPFAKPRGFTVFYYHPQGFELGRAVHDAMAARIRLPDEGLRWANLLVTRLPAMPSILIENAYMIIPEQEALLNDAAFRDQLAAAIVDGLKTFMSRAAKETR